MENLYKEFIINTQNSKRDNASFHKISLKKKIDKMIEHIIEPNSRDNPSFIINHPTLLSPLAKSHDNNPLLAERFEFFLNGIEIINSYSELKEFYNKMLQSKS